MQLNGLKTITNSLNGIKKWIFLLRLKRKRLKVSVLRNDIYLLIMIHHYKKQVWDNINS